MNILFHFRTQGTGAEGVHIAGMAGAFRRLGHHVVFCNPRSIDPTATAGANPFGSARRSVLSHLAARAPKIIFELLEIGYNLAAGWRLNALFRCESFDLIYERHAFFLCVTALLADRRKVPLIVEVNELAGDERIRAQPWLLPLARWADGITFRRARLIVVVSPHLRRRIEAMGVPGEKILVLPNAVDEQTLTIEANGAGIRGRFHCQDALVIGFVGWFVPWHRLEILLGAFAALAAKEPALRLMLVGDGPLRGALEAQATALGVSDRVIFSGAVPHAEMLDYLAAMDIGVVPHSNAYRSPIKLFESMAAGRPVVAPRTEPIGLVITHGGNGLLFEPENEDDLRTQLAALIADAELRTQLGRQAQADVVQKHTWVQNAGEVLSRLRVITEQNSESCRL
jgi:glycosyltransferase involved in cell wall biosynthesis